jgi:hypothetical protein
MPIPMPEHEEEVVREFLRSCTVPLVREVDDSLDLMGTGTFFHLEEQLWLVTAAHVIRTAEHLRELAVPMRTAGQFQTLGECTLCRPSNTELDLDVAVVLIQGAEFQQLVRQNWEVLDEGNITRFDEAEHVYIVAGYPRETLERRNLNWLRSFTLIYTNPYPGGADDADHPMLRLSYARSFRDRSGELADTPHLGGLSGASVWAVSNPAGNVWTPRNFLKVVAVQVAFRHDAYIACEWWTLVSEVFRRARE